MSLLPARMNKIQSKMKSLDFSPYKSMGIFPDIQRQLTPPYVIQSGRISNSVETLWLSSLLAKNEEDQIKNEGARVAT